MKVTAFGASNSKNSINKKLATWAANQIKNAEIEILDLNDFELPIYSIDRETESGIPQLIHAFVDKIDNADLIIISLAENNGSYSTAFKNIYDWTSRIPNRKVWGNKNMLLLSTSPGPRGGTSVLEAAISRFPRDGGNIVGSFSLPSFQDNFQLENGILNAELKLQFHQIIENIK